jgi:hypothetical protein
MDELSIVVLSLAGCVFSTSAGTKLRSRPAYRAFCSGLRQTGLVPGRLLPAAAAVLAGAEAVAAAGLLGAAALAAAGAPWATAVAESALGTAALLISALTAGVAVVVRRGTRARCACFGVSSSPLGRVHLARNLALVAVLGAGLVGSVLAQGRPAPAGAALAAGAGAIAALLFVQWEELAGLIAPIPTSGSVG